MGLIERLQSSTYHVFPNHWKGLKDHLSLALPAFDHNTSRAPLSPRPPSTTTVYCGWSASLILEKRHCININHKRVNSWRDAPYRAVAGIFEDEDAPETRANDEVGAAAGLARWVRGDEAFRVDVDDVIAKRTGLCDLELHACERKEDIY